MTHDADPELDKQLRDVAAGATVVLPARRRVVVCGVVGAFVCFALGVVFGGIVVAGFSDVGAVALFSKPSLAGALCLVFGVWLLRQSIRGMTQPRRLLIGPDGFREEVHRRDGWELVNSLAWNDIEEVFVQPLGGRWPFRSHQFCSYRLTEAAAARQPQPKSALRRRIAAANERNHGARAVTVAKAFGSAPRLLELLGSVHRQYSGNQSTTQQDRNT